MAIYSFQITPGTRGADDERLRTLVGQSASEMERPLDDERIRSVAAALHREHPELGEAAEDATGDEEPSGTAPPPRAASGPSDLILHFDWSGEDDGPEVVVDATGVVVDVYVSNEEAAAAEKAVRKALAIAGTAARLVDGAIWDDQLRRAVELREADVVVREAANRATSSAAARAGRGAMGRAPIIGLVALILLPHLAYRVYRSFASGFTLFALTFGTVVAGAVLLAWYARRSQAPWRSPAASSPGVPGSVRPPAGPGEIDGKPISPG